MASPLTHLEESANATLPELWCKHMEQQTDALPVKAMDKSMCQGVGNGLKTSWTKRNSQVQPREVVQADGPGHAAEQVVPGDQHVQMDQEPQQQRQRQHASVPEPSAQPSSSSHEEPMQVSTTSASCKETPMTIDEMRTVRPRMDMSALINELCERDVPEIDWEKLAMDNRSVCDIFLNGLKLDEELVRAGRETEVKRMLEFEVYEEVNEEQARGKRIWSSAWLDFTDKDQDQ